MEQHEASGSNAAEMVGDHDARYSNDLDERYMGSRGMSREHINYRHELDRLGREPRTHTSTHQRWRKEEPWIRAETEIEPLKEEARKQIIEEYERKQRSTKARAEAEEVELIERLQLERQEEMAEEVRVFESTVRKKCDQRKAANIPQLDPPDGSEIRSEERPPTLTDLFQQSLEKGVEDKDGFWSNRYKIPIGPTGAPRVCQWSIFGHDGIVTRDEPASEERLRQITAELRRTGDLVILIENIGHPHVGNLGSLLELPDEAFYGLADFPRCHNHNENESRAHKLTIIDDGIERVFRRARMLSSENSKIKAMIRNLGNSMTATRDLLWFFDLHPEGARRSHVIMSTLLEVIPIILKSLPLIDRSARDIYPQPDAMFLEALTSQVEGQLEECRLHWLFCVKEISITSTASERNNYDAKILCIRAKKGVCRVSRVGSRRHCCSLRASLLHSILVPFCTSLHAGVGLTGYKGLIKHLNSSASTRYETPSPPSSSTSLTMTFTATGRNWRSSKSM